MAYLNEVTVGGTTYDLRQKYPVGAIYLSSDSTSPASLFGGTWERIEDCFLLAAGTSYAAGSTGGEAEHTLTVDEMPSHSHKYQDGRRFIGEPGGGGEIFASQSQSSYIFWRDTGSTGGDQPHNNLPPYLAVYVWKRIA